MSQTEPLILETSWNWTPHNLTPRIGRIWGGRIPGPAKGRLQHTDTPSLNKETKEWCLGKMIADCLVRLLPPAEPIDFGTGSQFEGVVVQIQFLNRYDHDSMKKLQMAYELQYSNGLVVNPDQKWDVSSLPQVVQDLIKELDGRVRQHVYEWFWQQYGRGEINPSKWGVQKTEVFISHRGKDSEIAQKMWNDLGEYQEQSLFLPRIDAVDMQAGNWLDQLMKMIKCCAVFIPVLSKDYLNGPISRPELDQALREHYSDTSKRIIPVLVEGSPEDYRGHFLGGFHMVGAQAGIDHNIIDKIAYLALGISLNPYE